MAAKTLFEKIWEEHVVREKQHEPSLLYIDLHLVHEVTSPQAFEGLRHSGRKVRAPHRTYATQDHNVPTTDRSKPITDADSKLQIETLRRNCAEFGLRLFDIGSREQGIVHVIGPELGLTQPGMTIVCGDSHTATHGAFGALAFGIGTSEVEHVLATQCLWEERPQTFEIRVDGKLGTGVGAKDLILGIIGRIKTNGATGHVIEYRGAAVEALSMEERMTVCNMSIEGGARAGMVAADKTTVEYLRGRRYIPTGKEFDTLAARWLECRSDDGAKFDRSVAFDAATFAPQVTWGTNPGMVTDVRGSVPNPAEIGDKEQRETVERALTYMALRPGTKIEDIKIDRVFIGSCTNSRLSDLQVRRRYRQGPQSRADGACDGGAGLAGCESRGGESRTRQNFHGSRLRVARIGMQHVPGDESRRAAAGRAMRQHVESQLRRASRQGRPHASGESRDGGGGGDRGAFRRCARVGESVRRYNDAEV